MKQICNLLHPHNYSICDTGLRDPILEMRKLKLSRMKGKSLELSIFKEQEHNSEPGWPDSKVLFSTTHCITPENSPRERRGRAAHGEGRLVIKAQKIHDLLGN